MNQLCMFKVILGVDNNPKSSGKRKAQCYDEVSKSYSAPASMHAVGTYGVSY